MKLKQFFVAAVMLLSTGTMLAQQMPKIPVDKDVRIGHLSNGLTYYIRHNNFPEHVASFYIAQKVGSINENDDQRGLAHLLEHLAFNGSDHFKGNSLQDYLQGIGVEYGRNLNAYTAVEQTVYYFTDVPTTRTTAVDSCMLILKDWSNGITLTKEAIEGERDIVHNEYRMRIVGQQRMLERSLPKLFPNSKYGYRMPIGLMSVVDGCDPETLRAYYRKWYRPDNQAIIIVGDVDVDHIEAKIKELFSGIKVPANAAKVIPEQVPDNDTAIYVIDKDKEQQNDVFQVYMKHDPVPDSVKSTVEYFVKDFLDNAVCGMLNDRYAEKSLDENCPYLQAGSGNDDYILASTKAAFMLSGVAKPGKIKEAYAAVLREAKRAKEFGFTATEYARAKENFMSYLDKVYSNRDKMKNEQFTSQYVSNFLQKEPIPSVEEEYQLYQMIVPNIPLEAVNAYAKDLICESDTNFVSLLMMRDVDGAVIPTEQELANVVKDVRAEKLEAYVDNVKQEPLMAELPKPGKIKKTVENTKLGFKELTLSNGAKVILKKTDFKNDEIQFMSKANIGTTAFDKKDWRETKMLDNCLGASGLGGFTSQELSKMLAGKIAGVNYWLGAYKHGLSGSSTPKDLETMMQLLYLSMTSITKDEKAFNTAKNALIASLTNQSSNPSVVYRDSIQSTLYKGNIMYRYPKADEVAQVSYDRALEMAKQLFYGRAKDYTYYFVGNFDEAKLLPLIEQYIASLPNDKKAVKMQNHQIEYASGIVKNNFTKEMENPQTQACEYWRVIGKQDLRTDVILEFASRMLEMDYNRNIRERLSAAYSAGASASTSRNLDGSISRILVGSAMLNPEKADEAIPCFFEGMKKTVDNPDVNDFNKVKEILLKQAEVSVKTNGYWMGILNGFVELGVDAHTPYKDIVKSITPADVSNFLKNVLLTSGNQFEIIMRAAQASAK